AENRLTSFNNGSTTYIYDGEGKRVEKMTGGNVTVYVYDALGRLVAEYDASNSSSYTGAVQQIFSQANQTNWPIQKVSYSTADPLGTPRVWTDSSKAVISRHDYAPFGEEIFSNIG